MPAHAPTPNTAPATLVDGHVHVHDCFDAAAFLDAAAANFEDAARRRGIGPAPIGVLLLTENPGDHFFRDARDGEGSARAAGWNYDRTDESDSLQVRRDGEVKLVLVAGRQLVTAESLEVLALGRDAAFQDRLPIRAALDAVRATGALAVIPWGFGKWWFGRGRLVRELVENSNPSDLALGDNGGRPRLGRRPALFRRAESRGLRVLPGSDPLPFPRHASRPGSYGFVIEPTLSLDRPAEDLRRRLRDPATRIAPYGAGERLLPFLRNQVAMQLAKRARGSAA